MNYIHQSPAEIDKNLNDIFKQVVVNRDWKNHNADLVTIYNQDEQSRGAVVDALRSIMLKIMVIPQVQ
jgi:hypothetical protein